jgi:hypothetical protein
VDRDGDPDLVLANRDGQGNHILLNDGHLSFEEQLDYGTVRRVGRSEWRRDPRHRQRKHRRAQRDLPGRWPRGLRPRD